MKRVILKSEKEKHVLIEDIAPERIYAFYKASQSRIYKLNCINGCWAFTAVDCSHAIYSITYIKMEAAIKAVAATQSVYEFESGEEFLHWALGWVD